MVILFFILFGPLDNDHPAGFTENINIKGDLSFIIEVNSPIKTCTREDVNSKEIKEIKLITMGFIWLYQLFISTQDLPVCNFTFSCSHFGMAAIKKYGILHGTLMTSDRLQRCNGFGRKYYPLDSQTGLAIDYPIEKYFLGH